MKPRMNIKKTEPKVYETMYAAEKQVAGFGLEPKLKQLIKMRVSQINGCGFCLNMHAKEARNIGKTEQRLHTLAAWWETPFFTEEEQTALRLAEEVTLISQHGVSDTTYEKAVAIFGEQGTAQLLLVILNINNWNRITVATHLLPEPD